MLVTQPTQLGEPTAAISFVLSRLGRDSPGSTGTDVAMRKFRFFQALVSGADHDHAQLLEVSSKRHGERLIGREGLSITSGVNGT